MSTKEHSLIKDFRLLKEAGRLSHSYLIFGESQAARRDFGHELLRAFEDGSGSEEILADGFFVKKDEEGKIGIDEARNIISFLWQMPRVSDRRTVFVDEADFLTDEAQNALLKVAEEPPAHGLLVFSALNPESLIPPLVSRCQKMYLPGAIQDESEEAKRGVELAGKFFKSASASRKSVIKEIIELEDGGMFVLPYFIRGLLTECRKDPVKNFVLMKRILDRWTKISEFNTNRKLQLEALLD